MDEVIRRASTFATCSYQLANKVEQEAYQGRKAKEEWRPPPRDILKINIDDAFREEEKTGAWGFMIRDCDGNGVLAGSGRLRWVHDALTAEREACLLALSAAMDAGISRVMIETDSTNLVSAVKSGDFDMAPGGVIFKEIRLLLSLHFVTLNWRRPVCKGTRVNL